MQRKESKFRSALISALRKNGVLIRAIETGETTEAFPDVYYCHNEVVCLIECKQQETIQGPSYTRKVPFRPGQHSFLDRNKKKGGNSIVAIQYSNCIVFADISAINEEDHLNSDGLFVYWPAIDAKEIIAWIEYQFKRAT